MSKIKNLENDFENECCWHQLRQELLLSQHSFISPKKGFYRYREREWPKGVKLYRNYPKDYDIITFKVCFDNGKLLNKWQKYTDKKLTPSIFYNFCKKITTLFDSD